MRRAAALLMTLALLVTACGGDGAATTTTTASSGEEDTTTTLDDGRSATTTTSSVATTSTSSTSTTTTTEAYTGPVSALNGLPIDDPALLERRVMAVKIDNHPNARPQSGLLDADAVVEILVEGGLTRFIALFHTTDSERLGPVRSGRPTDPTILAALDAVFTISGAQPWVTSLILNAGVHLLGEGPGTFRISSRAAPHNLYASTVDLRAEADRRGYADDFRGPLYEIASWDELPEEPATRIDLVWSEEYDHTVTWVYDDGWYRRFEGSTEHNWIDADGEEQRVAAQVLVVLQGTRYTAFGSSGSAVPATETTGTGPAYVFYQGKVAEGTWSRAQITDPFTLTAADGTTLTVPPGVPWISIFPLQQAISWA